MQAEFSDGAYGNVLVQPTGDNAYLIKLRFISEDEHKIILQNLRDKFEVVKDNGVSIVTDGQDSQLLDLEATAIETVTATSSASNQVNDVVENRLIEDRIETIGPAISSQLQKRSMEAAIAVIFAIVLYVGYAFRKVSKPVKSWKYGITAIIALIHDVTITMGVFALLGKFYGVEVDIPFVVAILSWYLIVFVKILSSMVMNILMKL
jgi:preprotein translocase subunit SecF